MIPKIIHYCWLSNDPIPADLKKCMDSWSKIMPEYEFIKWDFTRFDINSSKWVKSAFENKKYAFAADYIRLYALYNYGGIYLDMDVQVLKSYDSFLCLPTIIGWQNNKYGLEVAAFGAEKESKWIKDCLDYYIDRDFVLSDGKFETKVLPLIIYDELIRNGYQLIDVENIEEARNVISADNKIAVFPDDFFSPKSYDTGKIKLTNRTICIHHFAGSWMSMYEKIFKSFRDKTGLKNTGIVIKLRNILGLNK